MKLQVSLDLVTIEHGMQIAEGVQEYVDIIEIGTPLIIREGMGAVAQFKERFPHLEILADAKIMDGGQPEATYAFDAGADYVTVLAVAEDATVQNVAEVAQKYGKTAMADMIAVADVPTRARQMEAFGARCVCVHTGVDVQGAGRDPLAELAGTRAVLQTARTAVAGGITLETAPRAIQLGADILVVGSAIVAAQDPAAEARAFRALIEKECAK